MFPQFCNGSDRAIRIPRDFELGGTEAIIRQDGDRLIIDPLPTDQRLTKALGWRTQTAGLRARCDSQPRTSSFWPT